jgi:hypothetical protein
MNRSAGPKNFAYKLDTEVTQCTIKGFTMNNLTSLKISFDSIKEIVLTNQNNKIDCEQLLFTRNKNDWSVQTHVVNKNYGMVYNKRVIQNDLTTLPFGF